MIDAELVELVRDLCGTPAADIGGHASISATQALPAAGPADELSLLVAPTIVGAGRRLSGGAPPVRLEPIRGPRSTTGHLLVDYLVAR